MIGEQVIEHNASWEFRRVADWIAAAHGILKIYAYAKKKPDTSFCQGNAVFCRLDDGRDAKSNLTGYCEVGSYRTDDRALSSLALQRDLKLQCKERSVFVPRLTNKSSRWLLRITQGAAGFFIFRREKQA
jgi:hypothetical protein